MDPFDFCRAPRRVMPPKICRRYRDTQASRLLFHPCFQQRGLLCIAKKSKSSQSCRSTMKNRFLRWKRRNAWLILVALLAVQTSATNAPSSSSSKSGMILRVRLGDGSIQRIQVAEGSEDTTTLSKILSPLSQDEQSTIQIGSTKVTDKSQTLSNLGLKHGSLITITPPRSSKASEQIKNRFKMEKADRFDPFPDLARDYQTAVRRKATRRGTQGGMSYGDIAHVQSALHVVEPQPEGLLKRVYMCRISAERFQSNCIVKSKKSPPSIQSRVGLLLGTIQRERVDLKPVKARTSLSSTPSDQDYCQVAKVQALWEPPQAASTETYDAKSLENNAPLQRALQVANWLGLTPVGWIFSYTDSRSKDEDSLPVWAPDVHCGARLVIANMKRTNRQEGARFVTLAMDANTGATEAFQLSDVSVQMVAEDMWTGTEHGRFVTTHHEIIVDGKETTQLDSVLCLVNTAMLSQVGSYAGKTTNSVSKRNGSLTGKTKKALLAAMGEDSSLLNELSDFNVLVALDALLPAEQTEELCRLVKKWVRGQKHGTNVPTKLKLSLQSVLSS